MVQVDGKKRERKIKFQPLLTESVLVDIKQSFGTFLLPPFHRHLFLHGLFAMRGVAGARRGTRPSASKCNVITTTMWYSRRAICKWQSETKPFKHRLEDGARMWSLSSKWTLDEKKPVAGSHVKKKKTALI